MPSCKITPQQLSVQAQRAAAVVAPCAGADVAWCADVDVGVAASAGGELVDARAKVEQLQAELAAAHGKVANLEEELARCNRDFAHFAYVASHDLSEPLRVMSGYSGMLQRRYDSQLDERGRRYIGNITAGAERMQSLIDALLNYSRARSHRPQVERLSCEEILADVLTELAPRLTERGAVVAHDPLPEVVCDPHALHFVLREALINASRFCERDRPQIRVVSRREKGLLRLEVHDDGIGIDPLQRERVFELLARLHPRDDYPGLGTGLPVGRELLRASGARIWLGDSTLGGIAVCVELPAPPAHAVAFEATTTRAGDTRST